MAEQHQVLYSPNPYQPSTPFSLIHSDVWGPSRISSISNKKWFVTFIDDHTRLSLVYLLKEKSEVEDIFKIFYTMVQTQFQGKIKVFRSDNGWEYFNKIMGAFLF